MSVRLFIAIWLGLEAIAQGQGVFLYLNAAARTRYGSIDGPLAGPNIYGQMFAGPNPDGLAPVGPMDAHSNGIVAAGDVAVPGVAPYTYAYVQLLAWDGSLWGADLSSVPAEQIGRTDVVSVFLTTGTFPDTTTAPRFTRPAIVPIPEPAVFSLGVINAVVLLLCRRFLLGARRLPGDG